MKLKISKQEFVGPRNAIIWEAFAGKPDKYEKLINKARKEFSKKGEFSLVGGKKIKDIERFRKKEPGDIKRSNLIDSSLTRQLLSAKKIKKHEEMSYAIEGEKINRKRYEKNLIKWYSVVKREYHNPDHLFLLYIFYTRLKEFKYYIEEREKLLRKGELAYKFYEAIPFKTWEGMITIRNPILNISFTQPPNAVELISIPFALTKAYLDLIDRKNNDAAQIISLHSFIYLLMNFIHPFNDYNGRSTRNVIAAYLLKEGFAPPLYINPTKKDSEIKKMRAEFLKNIGRPHLYFDNKVRSEIVRECLSDDGNNWDLEGVIEIIIKHMYNRWDGLKEWSNYFLDKMYVHGNIVKGRK